MESILKKGLKLRPKVIDMTKLFEQDTLEWGLIVSEVRPGDIAIKKRGDEQRKNIIQITTSQYLLMWDIESEKEVSTLAGYDQFLTVDTFVRTGHTLYLKYEKQKMKKFKPLIHDYSYNLFCMPGIVQN